jgi:hypothetical protein
MRARFISVLTRYNTFKPRKDYREGMVPCAFTGGCPGGSELPDPEFTRFLKSGSVVDDGDVEF